MKMCSRRCLEALFDTNVLIAAFLTEGLCSSFLEGQNESTLSYTHALLCLLSLRKSSQEIFCNKGEIKETLTLIKEASLTVNPASNNIMVNNICRDTDDDNVLACALAAKADYLVTETLIC